MLENSLNSAPAGVASGARRMGSVKRSSRMKLTPANRLHKQRDRPRKWVRGRSGGTELGLARAAGSRMSPPRASGFRRLWGHRRLPARTRLPIPGRRRRARLSRRRWRTRHAGHHRPSGRRRRQGRVSSSEPRENQRAEPREDQHRPRCLGDPDERPADHARCCHHPTSK